jgi:hypothetical protein
MAGLSSGTFSLTSDGGTGTVIMHT